MDRKDFIKASCTLCGLGIVGVAGIVSLMESCKKADTTAPSENFTLDLTASANAALNTVGGSIVSNQVVIIRIDNNYTSNSFVALTQICTHNGCSVAYNNSSHTLVCPCHGGTFDTNGNVISGPPPSALKKYTVVLTGNSLKIS